MSLPNPHTSPSGYLAPALAEDPFFMELAALTGADIRSFIDLAPCAMSSEALTVIDQHLATFFQPGHGLLQAHLYCGDLVMTGLVLARIKQKFAQVGIDDIRITTTSEVTQQSAHDLGMLVTFLHFPQNDSDWDNAGFAPNESELASLEDAISAPIPPEDFVLFNQHIPHYDAPTPEPEVAFLPPPPNHGPHYPQPSYQPAIGYSSPVPFPVNSIPASSVPHLQSPPPPAQKKSSIFSSMAKQVYEATNTACLDTFYVKQTVRSGQEIVFDGNIIVVGDVHAGSEIIAKGDITIWGELKGIAHAGSQGNELAEIRALKISALQLRIGEAIARQPDRIYYHRDASGATIALNSGSGYYPEVARVVDGEIKIYPEALASSR